MALEWWRIKYAQLRVIWYILCRGDIPKDNTIRNNLVEEIASYMTQAQYHVTPNEIREKFKEK